MNPEHVFLCLTVEYTALTCKSHGSPMLCCLHRVLELSRLLIRSFMFCMFYCEEKKKNLVWSLYLWSPFVGILKCMLKKKNKKKPLCQIVKKKLKKREEDEEDDILYITFKNNVYRVKVNAVWEIHINYLSFNGWLLFFASSRLFSSPTVMWGSLTHRQDNGSASKWSFIPTNLAVSLSDKLFALLFFLVFFLTKYKHQIVVKSCPASRKRSSHEAHLQAS